MSLVLASVLANTNDQSDLPMHQDTKMISFPGCIHCHGIHLRRELRLTLYYDTWALVDVNAPLERSLKFVDVHQPDEKHKIH